MDDSHPICYWKGSVLDFLDPNPLMKWLPMINDLAVGKVKDPAHAGLIQLKMSFNPKPQTQEDWKVYDAWKRPPANRLDCYKVRIYIFQCKDIPSADEDGSSDCYIEAWTFDKKRPRTVTIPDNNNPIFMSTLEVYTSFKVRE